MQVRADILTEDFPDPVIPITLSLGERWSSSRKHSTHRMMTSICICSGVLGEVDIQSAMEVGLELTKGLLLCLSHIYILSATNMSSDRTLTRDMCLLDST
jgi:hypothetical protein